MFRVSGERVGYLTSEEEKRLSEQLGEYEWLKGIVVIALHTGMRRGEICGLQWVRSEFRAWINSRSEYPEWQRQVNPNECDCQSLA